jgi:hypothetical protein
VRRRANRTTRLARRSPGLGTAQHFDDLHGLTAGGIVIEHDDATPVRA